MSLDNYFRLLRTNQHKRLINPVKRIDKYSPESENDSQHNPKQSFSDVMDEFLDDELDDDNL